MRNTIIIGVGLILLGSAASVRSQDVIWRAAQPAQSNAAVKLGQPTPLGAAMSTDVVRPVGIQPPAVVRGQIGEPPPPPAFPGAGAGPAFPPPAANMYNQGVVNNDSDLGGFWTRFGDKTKRCWDEITGNAAGAFQSGAGRQPFQSDHDFDVMSSPISNPFFFEDPRALTEIRPFFIWQRTPSANPVWNGGSDFDYGVRGSVAITPNISMVFSRLGFTTISPKSPSPLSSHTGFSEFLLGPKITFLRSETSGTVAAFGLTFDLPTGNANVLQNTGHLMLDPYFSIAQNFGKSSYGSFNFMNTTGYTFRTDNTRTEAFYSSFHLDYEIAKRVWPTIEFNWRHYTRNGGANNFNFEGSDLANFGSQHISGQNELTLALGTRVKLNNYITWGIAAEFNVLANSSGQHLDAFRLTTDFIFRY